MAPPKYLRIRNWERYQHYKTGRHSQGPLTWVKLHTSMLHDHELTSLSIEAQLLADRLLLVAGMSRNCVPNDPKWIASATKVSVKCVPRALDQLRKIRFVEPISARELSRQGLAQSREEESREETPQTPLSEGSVDNPSNVVPIDAKEWLKSMTANIGKAIP